MGGAIIVHKAKTLKILFNKIVSDFKDVNFKEYDGCHLLTGLFFTNHIHIQYKPRQKEWVAHYRFTK